MRLALEAGTFVRADRLVEDVWAEDAVNTRRNTLQSKIAKLRRAFGDPQVIVSGDGGYTLAVEPSEVDALAVLRDTATAAELLDAGDDRGAADLSASALERYRGDLLQGAGGLGRPAPGAARRGAHGADGDAVRGAPAARRGGRPDRRPGVRRGDVSLSGRSVGAADHRAVPGGTPGRCAGDLPAGPRPARGRARSRSRTPAAGARATDPGPRPGPRHRRSAARALEPRASREPAVARRPSSSAARRRSPPCRTCSTSKRLVEIVGPGGIGKTAVAIATGRRLAESDAAPAGSGWPGSKPRRRRTTSSTR